MNWNCIFISLAFLGGATTELIAQDDTEGFNSNVLEIRDSIARELGDSTIKVLDSIAAISDPFFRQSKRRDLDDITIDSSFSKKSDSVLIQSPFIGTDSLIKFEFIKYKEVSPTSSSIQNLLRLINQSDNRLSGLFNLEFPNNWRLLGPSNKNILLDPNDTLYIPVRLFPSNDILGGISYVVFGKIDLDSTELSAFSYIEFESIRDVVISTSEKIIHVDPKTNKASFSFTVLNRGNTLEDVDIEVTPPSGFEIARKQNLLLRLNPNEDTIVTYELFKTDTSSNSDFFSKQVVYRAQYSHLNESGIILVYDYKSYYRDALHALQYPLKLTAGVFNLAQLNSERMFASADGMILINKNHNFKYKVSSFNLSRIGQYDFNNGTLNNTYNYSLSYQNKAHHINSSSRLFVEDLPIRFQGLNYIYDGVKRGYQFGAGRTYLPNALILYGGINLKNLKFPSKFRATSFIGSENFKMQVYSLKSELINRKKFKVSGGLTHYNGMNSTLEGQTPLRISSFGYQGSLVFNSNPFHSSAYINLRRLYGYNRDGQNFVARIRGSFDPQNNLKHSFIADLNSNEIQIGQSTRSLRNTNLSYRISIPRSNHYNFSITPSYRALNRQRPFSVNTAYESTQQFGIGTSVTHSISRETKIFLSILPTINSMSFTLKLNDGLSEYSLRSKSIFAYTLSAGFLKHKKSNLSIGFFRGPVYNYLFNINLQDSSLTPYSSSFIRLNGQYFQNIQLNFTVLRLSHRGLISYDLVNNALQVNLGTNASAELSHGFSAFSSFNLVTHHSAEVLHKRSSTFFNINLGVSKVFRWDQPYEKFRDLKIICFEDINSNDVLDDNEPRLENIIISLQARNNDFSDKMYSQFPDMQLVTDNEGTVALKDIPCALYQIEMIDLFNMYDLYPTHGRTQDVLLHENTSINIPFQKNYRITGKIKIYKDRFTAFDDFNFDRIKIRLVSLDRETSFETYSDQFGNYSISVNLAGIYHLELVHPWGDQLISRSENILIDFNGMKEFKHDIILQERQRQLNLKNAPSFAKDSADNNEVTIDYDQIKEDGIEQIFNDKNLLDPSKPETAISREDAINVLGENFEEIIDYQVHLGTYRKRLTQKEFDNLLDVTSKYKITIDFQDDALHLNKEFDKKQDAEFFIDSMRVFKIDSLMLFGRYADTLINLEK